MKQKKGTTVRKPRVKTVTLEYHESVCRREADRLRDARERAEKWSRNGHAAHVALMNRRAELSAEMQRIDSLLNTLNVRYESGTSPSHSYFPTATDFRGGLRW